MQDPRNLGACLRTADGAGVDIVVLPNDRSAGITEVVRHVAAGAAENLPLARVGNLSRYLEKLSERSIRLVGTSDQAKQSIYQCSMTGPFGLVMGAEEREFADSQQIIVMIWSRFLWVAEWTVSMSL